MFPSPRRICNVCGLMSGVELEFAALTDVGRQREHNEDNYLVDKKLSLFVVCDGMGGHAAGEVASAIAVRTVHDEVKKEVELLTDYAEGKSGAARVNKRDLLNMLDFAVKRASAKVHAEATKDSAKRGMGTTLVAVLFAGNQAFVTWVGDSRLYLLRDGVLEQVTEDHTVYNELVKRKKLSREQVEKLAPRNAITRAVGVYEHTEPDSLVLDVLAGDRFLLCSDGLYGYFEDENMSKLGELLRTPDETDATQKMITAANEAGGKDNITAIVITAGDRAKRDENRARKLQLKRDILAQMPLFRRLGEKELRRVLQVTDVQIVKEGTIVVREGERGEELYVVLSGEMAVLKGDAAIARFGPGDHFGEMALVRGGPRTATVRAQMDTELIVLRRPDFFEILRTESELAVKLLWQFLGVLAERLETTSRDLGAAKDQLMAEEITEVFEDEDGDRKSVVLPPPPPSLRRDS